MTTPKRDARALLATGGLLLIPLAALWLLVSPARHHDPGGPAPLRPDAAQNPRPGGMGTPADPGTPAKPTDPAKPGVPAPPPRVAAGTPAQADWTLLAVTVVPRNGVPTPPAPLAPPVGVVEPPGMARNPYLRGAPGAVGLWIGVRGGLGVKTLTIPVDGRRHAYPFGHFFVVSSPPPSSPPGRLAGAWTRWEGPGGMSLFDMGGQPPYEITVSAQPAAPGRTPAQTVTLMPSPISGRFRVTAQPLSAEGRPTGQVVGLLCQPVTATALFAQIPVGYSAATHQFRVTVARAGGKAGAKNGSAAWQIADVPPAAQNGTDTLPPAVAARVGPFIFHAAAAEAEDTSGGVDSVNRHPNPNAGPNSLNMDGHLWTGVPTVRYLLTARAASPPAAGQSWLFQLDRVTPQWGAPPSLLVSPANGPDQPLGLFPLPSPYGRPASQEWTLQDGEVGTAYPGQQRRVTLEGTAIRFAERTETVTFHDADVVWDAGFGGDRIVWHHPETQTTPSGIAVTVLNGRPGRRDTTDAPPGGQGWWYDRGNAELLLAWRLPPGVVSGPRAALNAPRVAQPPQGVAPLLASWDNTRSDPYGRTTAPPGGVDSRPLTQAGFSLLRLSVWAAGMPKRTPLPPPQTPKRTPLPGRPGAPPRFSNPEDLPPYSWRDGPFVLTAAPLPRHLPTLTLQIPLHEEQERRPVRLVVPVRGLSIKIAP